MTTRERLEYTALRATIRERGTARTWMFLTGLSVWAGLAMTILVIPAVPLASLLTLLVLQATFEAVFGMHVGVERIGRYLQVFHELEEEPARWEHVAMAFGKPLAGTGADPIFVIPFLLAVLFNFVTAVSGDATPVELTILGLFHLLSVVRIVTSRRTVARQRTADLERFRELKKRS